MKYLSASLFAIFVLAASSSARAQNAETLLEDAKKHMARAEFAKALELLEEARKTSETPKPEVLAEIYYTQGVLLEIRNSSPREALISFYRALRIRPELDAENARERARKLLACAASWVKSGIGEDKVIEIFLLSQAVDRNECPDMSPFLREAVVNTPPAPPKQTIPKVTREETKELPAPATIVEAPAITEKEQKQTWPLWLGGAVALSSTAVATGAWMHALDQARKVEIAALRYDEPEYNASVARAENAMLGYHIGLGVAITAAVASAAYAVYTFWPDEEAAVE